MKKVLVLTFVLFLFTSCRTSVTEDAYNSGAKVLPDELEFMSKPGTPAEDVDPITRVYIGKEQDADYIGLDMNSDDVIELLSDNGYELGEPSVQHSGEVMKGWWNDGTSTSYLEEGIEIAYDKAGNVYEINITGGSFRYKDVTVGMSRGEIIDMFGEPDITVNYGGIHERVNYSIGRNYLRFGIEEDKVVHISVSETVMEYVLYEFMDMD